MDWGKYLTLSRGAAQRTQHGDGASNHIFERSQNCIVNFVATAQKMISFADSN